VTHAAHSDEAHGAPQGFVRIPDAALDAFTGHVGPFYARFEGEALVIGFRVARRHSNPGGICHGGALMTFADVFMAVASAVQGRMAESFLPTINLSADFLAPTPLGSWVEGRTDMLRKGRNFVFAQGMTTADGVPVMRSSGIFKIPSGPHHTPTLSDGLRRLLGQAA
jgi:uncharacterized protein (TIGR00369 family)